jgi:hypothetical protein
MSSAASAADDAAASPNPSTDQTYKLYLGTPEPFGSVVVNTAAHKCTFAELPTSEELKAKGVCSLGSGGSSISAWLHINSLSELVSGEFTFLFTVHRRSGPVAYSGLGVEFVRAEFGRRTLPVWVELKP